MPKIKLYITLLQNLRKIISRDRKFTICIFSILLPLFSYGQKCVIANSKTNLLYAGISNPLEIAINKSNCEDFVLTSEDGIIKSTDFACTYSFIKSTDFACTYSFEPNQAGITYVCVVNKASRKTIDSVRFHVANIPDPVALVANKNGGIIKKSLLQVQLGISSQYQGFDFDARANILAYTAIIIREDSVIFSKNCEGALFPQEIKDALYSLQNNDRLIFCGIRCIAADRQIKALHAIEFEISN